MDDRGVEGRRVGDCGDQCIGHRYRRARRAIGGIRVDTIVDIGFSVRERVSWARQATEPIGGGVWVDNRWGGKGGRVGL